MDSRKIVLCTSKGMICSVRTSCRFVREHPFLSSMSCFVILLYICFPTLFGFLVSSSPVIICTAVLLGVLLSYGEPNVPEIEEKQTSTPEESSLVTVSVDDDLSVEKDDSFYVEKHVEEFMLVDARLNTRSLGETFVPYGEYSDGSMDCAHMTSNTVHIYGESYNLDNEAEFAERSFQESRGLSFENTAGGSLQADNGTTAQAQKDFEAERDKNDFDYSFRSPWQPVERADASSDAESDRAESSSPDASLADIIPILDELHPLLDHENLQPTNIRSVDSSDAASESSSEGDESDDASSKEAPENYVEEDDEVKEEREEYNEVEVKWTADDRKNLMDLGCYDPERNRRLESLIAKRRARKNIRFEMENLIDLDDDIDPIMEQLSGLRIHPISSRRKNPFDPPFDLDVDMDLPPIPGSAPSILIPGRNPFDYFLHDPVDESFEQTFEKSGHHDFTSASHREILFQRHESFSMRPSYYSEQTDDKQESRFKTSQGSDEGIVFSTCQGQSSGNIDSKVGYFSESGNDDSSIAVHVDQRELSIQEFHQDIVLMSSANRISQPIELGSQSSKGAVTMEASGEQMTGIINDKNFGFEASGITEGARSIIDAYGSVREETKSDVQDVFPIPVGPLDVILESFEGSFSSYTSEERKNDTDHSIIDTSASVREEIKPDMQDVFPIPVGHLDVIVENFEGSLSSSNSDERKNNMEFDNCETPKALKMSVPSGDGAPAWANERVREDLAHDVGGSWVASSSLSTVDITEMQSKAVSVIHEVDVIGEGYPGSHGDFVELVGPEIPVSATVHMAVHPSFSSIASDLSEDNPLFGGNVPNAQLHEDATTNNPADNQDHASSSLASPMVSNSLLNVSRDPVTASNEAYTKLNVIEEIDEELLAELDAVGDFHTGMPGKAAQSVMGEPEPELLDSEFNEEQIVYKPKLQTLEELDLYYDDMKRNVLLSGPEYSHDNTGLEDAMALVDAADSMVDDSALLEVVEAHSLEDLHLEMRYLLADSSCKTNVEVKPATDPETEGFDSQMPVVDAKSIEDIELVFEQLHKGRLGEPTNSENESPAT